MIRTRVIAVPLFDGRIAPRFDYCRAFLVVHASGGTILEKRTVPVPPGLPGDRIRLLREHNVGLIICGGIGDFTIRQVQHHGIALHPWHTGDAEDAVLQFCRAHGHGSGRGGRGRRLHARQRGRRWSA